MPIGVIEILRLYAATRQHPTPAQAQGEKAKALEALEKHPWGSGFVPGGLEILRINDTIKAALSHAPEVVTEEQVIEKTGYVDIYEKIIASGYTIIKRTE